MSNTAPVLADTAPVLADLATKINAAHREAEIASRCALDHALHAGELLIEAKAAVPHGQFLVWIDENCAFSQRSAQAYMRLSRKLPEKAQRVAHLPLRLALEAIAEPAMHNVKDGKAHTDTPAFARAIQAIGPLASCGAKTTPKSQK